jgi:hypothetical protein
MTLVGMMSAVIFLGENLDWHEIIGCPWILPEYNLTTEYSF